MGLRRRRINEQGKEKTRINYNKAKSKDEGEKKEMGARTRREDRKRGY